MSVEAFSWALNAPIGGNAKIVLLGLANHAHADGTNAYPAVDRLAKYAHCDRRTVQRMLRQLTDAGLIRVEGSGPNGTQSYRLASTPEGAAFCHGDKSRVGGGTGDQKGAAPVSPKPSVEPSIEPADVFAREESQTMALIRRIDEAAERGHNRFQSRWVQGDRDRVTALLAAQAPAVAERLAEWLAAQAVIGWQSGQSIAVAAAGRPLAEAKRQVTTGAREASPPTGADLETRRARRVELITAQEAP